MKHNKTYMAILTAALVVGIGAVIGSAGAVLVDETVSLDDPGNQTVEASVDFSGSTDATMNLSRSGTTVKSTTDSGSSGDTKTLSINGTGLDTGEYNLTVSASDESSTTLNETRLETSRTDVVEVSETQNETVVVDVAFAHDSTANATVSIKDSTGSEVNSSTISYDPVAASGGTDLLTTRYDTSGETVDGNLTVDITTVPAAANDESFVSLDKSSGAFLAALSSASTNQLALLAGALLVLYYARSEGMI